MDYINKLFNGKGYIEGISIINTEGEILFTAKFNNKLESKEGNVEVVGKRYLDVYENLDENTSTAYIAMRKCVPVYKENQNIKSVGREPISITSLSIPIKSGRTIVGAIDLSVSGNEGENEETIEIEESILQAYNKVESLNHDADKAKYSIEDILTCDGKMLELKDNILKMGKVNLPVMIYGETGTGKELVAHALHKASKRADKPFVVQNCASIPPNLMESILFGTSKGAFTGAMDSIGLFELADGGTLFLDEINSMPIELQPKILRVIQEGTFRKVGDKETIHVDVRVISSTNERPENLIKNRHFREDLYYRLSVLSIEIPPLRQRKKDIPLLTNFFISKYNKLFNKKICRVSNRLYDEFEKCLWKGNVRELENMIAYGVGMADDDSEKLEYRYIEKRMKDISSGIGNSELSETEENTDNKGLNEMVAEFERQKISDAMKKADNNITRAATILEIPRQTLSRKVNEYGIK